jgi:hypothetical protein
MPLESEVKCNKAKELVFLKEFLGDHFYGVLQYSSFWSSSLNLVDLIDYPTLSISPILKIETLWSLSSSPW